MTLAFSLLGMQSDYAFHWSLIFFLFLPLVARVYADYKVIKSGVEVMHFWHLVMTALAMAALSCYARALTGIPVWKVFVLQWGVFWLFFDYALNVVRGKKWYYIDQGKDGKSSLTDKVYNRIGILGTLFVKFWWFVFCLSVSFFGSYVTGY